NPALWDCAYDLNWRSPTPSDARWHGLRALPEERSRIQDHHVDQERRLFKSGRVLVSAMRSRMHTPREAAQILGISYPAIKQWIYNKKIQTVRTAGGHHRIPESEIDRFLPRKATTGEPARRRTGFRRISGRNQLVGRIIDIKVEGLMAQITLSIEGQRI